MSKQNLPSDFLSLENFQLAFERIARGQNHDYKTFYRPMLDAYNIAVDANLKDLINDIKTHRYRSRRPTLIYQPKSSGILRPLTLLCINDLIVYQALTNHIADHFAESLRRREDKTFGASYSGKNSKFFFRQWKRSYRKFNAATARAFNGGQVCMGEFDLVSFYELIDHTLLCEIISKKVPDKAFLEFFVACLRNWTISAAHGYIGHGIPQGPEPSAFLAECLLESFDDEQFENATYARYIDDVRIFSADMKALRRAMVKLDLLAKALGLVPQAQKIAIKHVVRLEDIRKTIPSMVEMTVQLNPLSNEAQSMLRTMLLASLEIKQTSIEIIDLTAFRYSLARLTTDEEILRVISPLLTLRPDCAQAISLFLLQFPKNQLASDCICQALQNDPIFDHAAAEYIKALAVCGRPHEYQNQRNLVVAVVDRSLEQSITLRIQALKFILQKSHLKDALNAIEREESSIVKSHLITSLFLVSNPPFGDVHDVFPLLIGGLKSTDEDYVRFCAASLVFNDFKSPPSDIAIAAEIFFQSVGLLDKVSQKASILKQYFVEKHKVNVVLDWQKALGNDLLDAESRAIRAQQLAGKDPSAYVSITDTLNEVLVQNFSSQHYKLQNAYKAAAHKNPHPDFGNWLTNTSLNGLLPKTSKWMQKLHAARVTNDLSHAKQKGGRGKGSSTQAITWSRLQHVMTGGKTAYEELLSEWSTIL